MSAPGAASRPAIAVVGNLCNLGYEFARTFSDLGRHSRLMATPSTLAEWARFHPDRHPREEPLVHWVGGGRWTGYLLLLRHLRRYDAVLSISLEGMQVLPWCGRPYVSYATGADLSELAGGAPVHPARRVALAQHTFKGARLVFYSPDHAHSEMIVRLGLSSVVPWRQMIDIDAWERTEPLRERAGDDGLIVFSPTNQIWQQKFDGQLLKRNDVLFHGFAQFLGTGGRGRLQYLNRGQDAAMTADLVARLGLTPYVDVIGDEMSRDQLRVAYGRADVVADQFEVGMGLIALEAMAAGRPVIGYVNPEQTRVAYPPPDPPPPLLSAQSPDGVCAALHRLADDETRKTLGAQSQDWVRRVHSRQVLGPWYLDRIDHAVTEASRRVRT